MENTDTRIIIRCRKCKDFVDVYFEDKKNELKERTCENKRDMMNRHIIPCFGDLKINDITPAQITK